MPEYLSPGVYVEETSFRSKSIEGVSTTTTGFVGPSRYGPVDLESDIVTSLVEFERVYGDGGNLGLRAAVADAATGRINYLWHAVRAFFAEGGKRLYVARTFARFNDPSTADVDESTPAYRGPDDDLTAAQASSLYLDGHARALSSVTVGPATRTLALRARYPGAYGNFRLRVRVTLGQNLLTGPTGNPLQGTLVDGDVVAVVPRTAASPTTHVGRYRARRDPATNTWGFTPAAGGNAVPATTFPPADYEMRVVTLTVSAAPLSDPSREDVWSGLTPDAERRTGGQPDGLTRRLSYDDANPDPNRAIPIVVSAFDTTDPDNPTELTDGVAVLSLFSTGAADSDGARVNTYLDTGVLNANSTDVREYVLAGGNDGSRPSVGHYEGTVSTTTDRRTGLRQFESKEDISIVAAPGATADATDDDALAVSLELITHCRRMRYRIAVLDGVNGRSIAQVRAFRARIDSSHAALYYPWVRVVDPNTRVPIHLPPSGFVAGIYARNDTERAVYKAPANEVVNLAIGFESMLNRSQQDVLNPEGVNCFRFFEGRGYRLWGARTASSDPEWKYVNLRRYFAYLERSIERGTQWAVFEPNGEALWGNVRRTIEDFLFNEFASGALLGDKPDKAYFVKCDRSTMTQNDLDNGRLVCLIGVAALRPAEFVIFRIGQWTGDRKV